MQCALLKQAALMLMEAVDAFQQRCAPEERKKLFRNSGMKAHASGVLFRILRASADDVGRRFRDAGEYSQDFRESRRSLGRENFQDAPGMRSSLRREQQCENGSRAILAIDVVADRIQRNVHMNGGAAEDAPGAM